MRNLLFVLTLLALNALPVSAAQESETVASYAKSLKQFMEKSAAKPSPYSAEDRAIMQKAIESLTISLPEPGIKVGEKAPNIVLKNAFGKPINLQAELKKGPVILVFYRGAWCPFCNMHLHVLQKNLPEFKKYGAQVIAITPQTPDKSAEQISKDAYPFEILSDLDSQAMRDYKLYYELPDDLLAVYKKHGLDIEAFNGKGRRVLPVAGSFVIDTSGIVRAMQADTDYKLRMEPADMLDALEKMQRK